MREIRIVILALWAGLSSLSSCSDSSEEIHQTPFTPDEILVRLVVSKPNTGHPFSSKATGNPDTDISEIQILVFEDSVYRYRVPGISITNTGTTTSFSARLLASDKRLDLYIVANATAAVLSNEPQPNTHIEEVTPTLQALFPANGVLPLLPMTGHTNLPSGLQAYQIQAISGINMLRTIARVDIKVGNTAEFELSSIQAYRANNRIQLISAPPQQ